MNVCRQTAHCDCMRIVVDLEVELSHLRRALDDAMTQVETYGNENFHLKEKLRAAEAALTKIVHESVDVIHARDIAKKALPEQRETPCYNGNHARKEDGTCLACKALGTEGKFCVCTIMPNSTYAIEGFDEKRRPIHAVCGKPIAEEKPNG